MFSLLETMHPPAPSPASRDLKEKFKAPTFICVPLWLLSKRRKIMRLLHVIPRLWILFSNAKTTADAWLATNWGKSLV